MTQPVGPWVRTTVRPGPSGTARAGSVQPFTNLSTDLDTNFTSFRNWATKVEAAKSQVTYSPASAWLTPATGWAHYTTPADVFAIKTGRFVYLTLILTYTGTILSSTTGDVSPDLLVATISQAACRPHVTAYLTCPMYVSSFVQASLQVNTDGTIYLTGLSAKLTVTNPGICGTFVWAATTST